jgi:hypothetical protein
MITDMVRKSNELEEETDVPFLWCESSSKVLYKWRGFLQRQNGRTMLAKDLLEGMYQNFRETVVKYGYMDRRAKTPERFDDFMKQIAVAAVYGLQ